MNKSKNINFKDSVYEIFYERWDDFDNNVLVRNDSPEWMINCGFNNYKILMNYSHVKRAIGLGRKDKIHHLSKETLINIPNLLDDPIAVFDYKKDGSILAILKEIDLDGKIIICVLKPNDNKRYTNINIDCNYIKSVYGRDEVIKFFDKVLNKGNIIYSDNNNNKQEIIKNIIILQSK